MNCAITELTELLENGYLFLDGGTGSLLQAEGLKSGELPERWNLSHADVIQRVHYSYFAAGSNMVCMNTFGAYTTKFDRAELDEIIGAAYENARLARDQFYADSENDSAPHPCFIAYDAGPSGKLLKPMGDLDFEDAVILFKTSIALGLKHPVDAIIIETMNDAYETKAAVIAAKEAREEAGKDGLPIFVTNVYDKESRLLSGATPEVMTALLEGLGVTALGLNCGLGPRDLMPAVERLVAASSLPVIVKPNAGLPELVNGVGRYTVLPADFARDMRVAAEAGARVFGGCCGTTPAHIRELVRAVGEVSCKPLSQKRRTIVSSNTRTVELALGKKPVLIGERINPTGKKKFKEALRNGDLPYIIRQGLEQVDAGADVLDVNVGLPEIDEKTLMVRAVTELQAVCDTPLQIDTSSPAVMEAALRRYNGIPLVNSVNGKREVMDAVFPLVKKYGGVVVALTLDEGGIPPDAAGRLEIVRKIVARAAEFGIPRHRIVVDALTMAVSSDSIAALATLQALRALRDEFGLCSVLGVSNISFGLPAREAVTASFFTSAMENGLTAAIINPLQLEMQKAYRTFCLLHGFDADCAEYIAFATANLAPAPKADPAMVTSTGSVTEPTAVPALSVAPTSESSAVPRATPAAQALQQAVEKGLKTEAAALTVELLKTTDSVTLIDSALIPGLDAVGRGFEQKTLFLPQLLMAAEAAKSSFEVVRAHLEKTGGRGESKGTVVLATVHGDIHDIGKNIVKVLLENYDFTVIDLGKDVPPQTVVDAVLANDIRLVGLSALMTTTVPAMKETIALLAEKSPQTKVVVGGAVLTEEYAAMIHAHKYARDALDTVRYAQEVFGR